MAHTAVREMWCVEWPSSDDRFPRDEVTIWPVGTVTLEDALFVLKEILGSHHPLIDTGSD